MRPQKFKGNVFVANLPKGYTDEDLAQAFDPYGIVIAAFLARDPLTGAAKGHGLVSLAPDRAAAAAVEAINGTKIGGQKVEARIADPTMALTIPAPPRRAFSSRPERSDYSSRPERSDYSSRPERSDYRTRPERSDYPTRPERSDYPSRPVRSDFSDRPEAAAAYSTPRAPRATFQVEHRSLPVGYRKH
ncbi:MAG: RNA-binding protein [Rhodospirillales bacterium]|jgi:RNA recognition motif-containing protein|nr:RNA-binding protein [Rhodospirillales bacterium]